MKIINDFPPNIEQIRAKFKLHKGIVFTYGDILYNPDRSYIDVALIVHEETHMKQQSYSPEEWWNKYLVDPSFRLSQELEAYRNQYMKLKKNIKDPFKLGQRIDKLAQDLSGDIYGNLLSFNEAKYLIVA